MVAFPGTGLRVIDCAHCGKTVTRSSPAKYCLDCVYTRPRTKAPRTVPADPQHTSKVLRVDGVAVCWDCKVPLQHDGRPPKRCPACFRAHHNFRLSGSGQQAAGTATRRAVKDGRLAKPQSLMCVDCGDQAECYDHRDYSKPLVVDPVCLSCNQRRGPAKPITAAAEA